MKGLKKIEKFNRLDFIDLIINDKCFADFFLHLSQILIIS